VHAEVSGRLSSAILAAVPALRRFVRSLPLSSLALLLACAGQHKGGREQGDEATRKTDVGAKTKPKHPREGEGTHEQPPVDVVALDLGDARPCERMCGRIGDCMLNDEHADAGEASGAEFACLDTCVYADPLAPASTAFQACDEASACGELLDCARGRWDAATAARRQVEIATEFAVVRDTCETACLTLQSCNFFYRMPNDIDGVATPEFYMTVDACTEGCRGAGEQQYAVFAECGSETSCDQFWACTSRAYRAYP